MSQFRVRIAALFRLPGAGLFRDIVSSAVWWTVRGAVVNTPSETCQGHNKHIQSDVRTHVIRLKRHVGDRSCVLFMSTVARAAQYSNCVNVWFIGMLLYLAIMYTTPCAREYYYPKLANQRGRPGALVFRNLGIYSCRKQTALAKGC